MGTFVQKVTVVFRAGGDIRARQLECSIYSLGSCVSSGGEPTPAGTSVFTKHNWDIGMEYLWLNAWGGGGGGGFYHLMG